MPDSTFESRPSADPAVVASILGHAAALVAAGKYRQAIDYTTEANRSLHAAELEYELMRWRMVAFPSIEHPGGRADWPPSYSDPFPGLHGLPEIDAAELTPEIVGGAFQHHGALWVHGLVSEKTAGQLRQGIDCAFNARDAHHAGTATDVDAAWYSQMPLDSAIGFARGWVEGGGGVWTADSPRMMFELIELFCDRGVLDVITDYLGERPALSVGKSTLRCVPCTTSTDWHQDGAFLGADVRTVNVWIALSDCGEDAPGLDVIGQRLDHVVQTGSHGAAFDWSVGPALVDILAQQGAPVVSPLFKAGDAMLFDQLMLHRTGVRPGMTKSRYAIESWFFAPSTYPLEQGPLLV